MNRLQEKRNKTRLYLDGDIILYKAAIVSESRVAWEDGVTSTHFDIQEGATGASLIIRGALSRLRDQHNIDDPRVYLCLSCRTDLGYRKKLFPDYKSGRGQKPLGLGALRSPEGLSLIQQHLGRPVVVALKDTLEADDIMGIAMGNGHIAVTDDKDLKTCPGTLIKLSPDEKGWHELHEISRHEANANLMMQWMTGDSTDSIPGLPGFGPVKAKKTLDAWIDSTLPWEEMATKVLELYESKGLGDKALPYFYSVYILRNKSDTLDLPDPFAVFSTHADTEGCLGDARA